MITRRSILGWVAGLGLGCSHRRPTATAQSRPAAEGGFTARRSAYATVLRRQGPSPGKWRERPPPKGAQEVRYPSPAGELLAYYAPPAGPQGRSPALIYLHGEFSLHPADFERVRPFVDAGFAVMTPSLRGENGNPGGFELLYGELDDAVAAVTWLKGQEGVDPGRIFALGHSVGGALSALLSLDRRASLVATASAGGIYVPETFVRWRDNREQADLIRFDPSIAEERELRSLAPFVAEMIRPHIAYVGDRDPWIMRNAEVVAAEAAERGQPFSLEVVAGDHGSMIKPAVRDYLARIV